MAACQARLQKVAGVRWEAESAVMGAGPGRARAAGPGPGRLINGNQLARARPGVVSHARAPTARSVAAHMSRACDVPGASAYDFSARPRAHPPWRRCVRNRRPFPSIYQHHRDLNTGSYPSAIEIKHHGRGITCAPLGVPSSSTRGDHPRDEIELRRLRDKARAPLLREPLLEEAQNIGLQGEG